MVTTLIMTTASLPNQGLRRLHYKCSCKLKYVLFFLFFFKVFPGGYGNHCLCGFWGVRKPALMSQSALGVIGNIVFPSSRKKGKIIICG